VELEQLRDALAHHLAGRYRLDQGELGAGGMAIVYGARDLRHERRVAVKLMRPEQAIGYGAGRFLREINLTATLQHPHILPLLDSGSVEVEGIAVPFYVMPLVAGQSLRTRLDVEGRLGWREAMAIARDIAEGLQYAHDRGVVHRDIKPENILVTESGAALVADFGVARATGADESLRLTDQGTSVGTPLYMSPEQLFGTAAVGAASDQYSFAATLFEMLAGHPPFETSTREELLARRLTGLPDSLRSHRPDLSDAVERALAKGLELKAADRYPTVSLLVEAVATAAGSEAKPTPPRSRWQARTMALLGAGLVIAGVGAWWSARRPVRVVTGGAMVILADVENLTSDSTLGRTLRVAATVALQQSGSFSLYPRSRLRTSLARMGRTIRDTVLSEALAREIAYRESGQAVIQISVTEIGDRFNIACRVIDPTSGADLASHQEAAARAEELVTAVERVAAWVRRRLGDTRWGEAASLPLVTTSSLPALRAYADGQAAFFRSDWPTARQLLERAVELDTGFAMAQAMLADYYLWTNQVPEGLRWIREANRRTDRLTEAEQISVEARLAGAEGRTRDQVALASTLATRFPSSTHWHAYGEALRQEGRYPEAIAALERAVAIDSTDAGAHHGLALAHRSAGNTRIAIDEYARTFQLDSTALLVDFSNQQWGETFVQIGDFAGAEGVFRKMVARPFPADQARGHRSLAYLALYRGRFEEAAGHLRVAIPLHRGPLSQYRDLVLLADAELTLGRTAAAQAALDRVFELFRRNTIQAAAVMFGGHQMVRAGQFQRASIMLDSLAARAALRPNSVQDQSALAILKADLALSRGRPDQAGAALSRSDYGDYAVLALSLRAEVFASRQQLDSAVAMAKAATEARIFGLETQQDWQRSFGQLGRLAEAAGDSATARGAYSSLIEQWREGDPGLPPLVDARKELERLQTAVRR